MLPSAPGGLRCEGGEATHMDSLTPYTPPNQNLLENPAFIQHTRDAMLQWCCDNLLEYAAGTHFIQHMSSIRTADVPWAAFLRTLLDAVPVQQQQQPCMPMAAEPRDMTAARLDAASASWPLLMTRGRYEL